MAAYSMVISQSIMLYVDVMLLSNETRGGGGEGEWGWVIGLGS